MIAFSQNKNGETYHTYGYTNVGWSDLLTSFDGGTITYDAIGNPLTYHDGKTFTWTAGRKLSTVTDGDRNYTYAYDGDGNRISKTVDGQTTDYYYIDGKLLGLKKGQDTLLFLYDETGTAYGFLHNGTLYYYDINLQGDVIGIYNGSGNLVASYTYDIWGAPELTSDNAIATLNPLRYRGYFYDEETGFYYLQSRYYDPIVGRFINADSVISGIDESVQGYNLFAYCNNNPVNMSDETGHWPKWSTVLKAAAIVVVAAAVVAAVAVTVSTCGAGSVAGVAVITAALSIGAKATEVAVLQAKKSTKKSKSTGGRSSSSSGGSSSNNNVDAASEKKSGGQVATDVIDAVFDNGITILKPSATKALTTGAAFVRDDLFKNLVLNTDFNRFITGSAKPLGMVTAYGFAAYAWIQTTVFIFCDDPEQRAKERGYKLK